MKLLKIVFFCAFAALVGCSNVGEANLDAPAPVMEQLTTYNIGVGDSLTVNVWRNPELTLDVQVRPDGKISMPLIGDVDASGRSASDLSKSIEELLAGFIRNPQVTTIVSNATSHDYHRRVRVTGAVEQPISIPFREGMTVLDLVLEAGGLTDFAMPNKARLYRKTNAGVEAYTVRLGDILNKGALSTNYQVGPSDILTIPERVF